MIQTSSLYRFSPITSEESLIEAIHYIHFASYALCKKVLGQYLQNAGNVGVFCHYEKEYEELSELRKSLTKPSDSLNQKYFALHSPIVIEAKDGVPEVTYSHLYIRKPDPYRHHVGDIDFTLSEDDYKNLKAEVIARKTPPGIRLFPSPTLDMLELYDPDSDVLAYVSTHTMADIVKVTKSLS